MFGNCSSFSAVALSPMRTAESLVAAWRLTQNSADHGGAIAGALTSNMASMPSKLNPLPTIPLANANPLVGVAAFGPAESKPLFSPRHQLIKPEGAVTHPTIGP